MHVRTLMVATAVSAVALGGAPHAHADPAVPPQAGTSCAPGLDGALTGVAGSKALLQCRDGSWQPYTEVYPSGDRWLTTDAPLTLHGQGMRNPEVLAGAWTGTPQDGESTCTATLIDVVAAGELGAPQTVTGGAGQPLEFPVSAKLFTVTLTGFCLWQRGS
jgi:hypothetical protein